MFSKQEAEKLFSQFKEARVMVVGDVMLDAYLFGTVTRISPEAPVPIVDVQRRANHLGGAANVALNINALKGESILCGVIGDDEKGRLFLELMEKQRLDTRGIIMSDKRPTTTKFRIFGSTTQLLRVDEESTQYLDNVEQHLFIQNLKKIVQHQSPDIILLQDYDKGVISKELITEIAHFAKQKGIPVIADPKRRNFSAYKDITLLKPNLKELREGLNITVDPKNRIELFEAIAEFRTLHRLDIAMVTLSEHGMALVFEKDGVLQNLHIPAHLRHITDVSGAGDTVISVAALCMAAKLPLAKMLEVANLAGGLVCEQVGVVPVDCEKLQAEILKL